MPKKVGSCTGVELNSCTVVQPFVEEMHDFFEGDKDLNGEAAVQWRQARYFEAKKLQAEFMTPWRYQHLAGKGGIIMNRTLFSPCNRMKLWQSVSRRLLRENRDLRKARRKLMRSREQPFRWKIHLN